MNIMNTIKIMNMMNIVDAGTGNIFSEASNSYFIFQKQNIWILIIQFASIYKLGIISFVNTVENNTIKKVVIHPIVCQIIAPRGMS